MDKMSEDGIMKGQIHNEYGDMPFAYDRKKVISFTKEFRKRIFEEMLQYKYEITPEFKQAMDEYEAFYDEYCDFMKRYTKADPTDALGMMTDYMKMLERMDKMNKKFDEMGDKEMSTDYIDVNARVQKKLLSVME